MQLGDVVLLVFTVLVFTCLQCGVLSILYRFSRDWQTMDRKSRKMWPLVAFYQVMLLLMAAFIFGHPLQLLANIPFGIPNPDLLQFSMRGALSVHTLPSIGLRHNASVWVTMPHPLHPNETMLASKPSMTRERADFWLTYMLLKYMAALVGAVLVLRMPCHGSYIELEGASDDAREDLGDQVRGLETLFTFCSCFGQLLLVTNVTVSASMHGGIWQGGASWEAWDKCVSFGLLYFLGLAMAWRMCKPRANYKISSICLSSISLLPFLGPLFDTLKDTVWASQCISSDDHIVQGIGVFSLVYLWSFHGYAFFGDGEAVLELKRAYLPFLHLRPMDDADEGLENFTLGNMDQLWGECYKQSTPARRMMLLVEDVPQGCLVVLVALITMKISSFTLLVNVLFPAARFGLAWLLHDRMAWAARRWLLLESAKALRAGLREQGDNLMLGILSASKHCCLAEGSDLLNLKPILEASSHHCRDTNLDNVMAFFLSCAAQIPEEFKHYSNSNIKITGIGDAGANAIAQALPQSNISSMNISHNSIGDAGAEAIAEALPQSNISSMNISWNSIGEAGGKAIAEALERNVAAKCG